MAFRAAILALALLALAACRTELHRDLSETEANEIVAALRLSGVPAERQVQKDGRVTVRVEDAAFADAVEILKAEGYPRKRYASLGEVFEGKGFVSSQTEERARFIFAMSEEISRTISEIDGILSARTHVVLPTADPLARATPPSSASVVIRHVADVEAASLLPQIKMMVANSLEGLDYSNVAVVFIPVAPRVATARPAAVTGAASTLGTNPMLWIGGGAVLLAILVCALALRLLRGPRGSLVVESAR